MFNCYLHGWSSHAYPCPLCSSTRVVTSASTYIPVVIPLHAISADFDHDTDIEYSNVVITLSDERKIKIRKKDLAKLLIDNSKP